MNEVRGDRMPSVASERERERERERRRLVDVVNGQDTDKRLHVHRLSTDRHQKPEEHDLERKSRAYLKENHTFRHLQIAPKQMRVRTMVLMQ